MDESGQGAGEGTVLADDAVGSLFGAPSPDSSSPRVFFPHLTPTPTPSLPPLVLTVESAPLDAPEAENAANYARTLRERGWDFRVLGRGAPWRGVITKMFHYAAALRALPANRLVFLTDARDVVCQGTPDGVEEAFAELTERTGAMMLASMEMFCDGLPLNPVPHPDAARAHCVDLRPFWAARGVEDPYGTDGGAGVERPFANSGLLAGRAVALLAFVRYAIAEFEAGRVARDQVALGRWMNDNPRFVAPDLDARLLHTSGSGVYNGCAHPRQATDGPNLGQLVWGRGARFLHVPGINVKRWPMQRAIYKAAMGVALEFSPRAAARAAAAAGELPQGVAPEDAVVRRPDVMHISQVLPWQRLPHGCFVAVAHAGMPPEQMRHFVNAPVWW
jgi:hypothetical protein